MLLGKLKLFLMCLVLSCIADFVLNTIFEPSITSTVFQTVILCMSQMVTILAQFFSWFFLLTSTKEVRMGGYDKIFKKFFVLFVTTSAYVILFAINKGILFYLMGKEYDYFDLWNHWLLLTTWSLQRMAALLHYGFSVMYVTFIVADPMQFLET